ncbi:MAG: tRNA dihydrouridine synthase DusB [Candidatus Stygibacter australis]|nr:tRNA dihydrouridine synthase DusB [Candidatus Stygibacter australis]
MKILDTKGLLWLAPLAGLTDSPFRTICKKWGADIVVSEMVSADGLKYSYNQTIPYARFTEIQRPAGIQIFGSNPVVMQEGAELIARISPDFIDINMGCPVKKVIKRGAGSALMRNPELAANIVKSVKQVCDSYNLPLTVKIRSGWDVQSRNAVDFALILQDAGADLIIIHPRTRSQQYAGKSDWDIITQIKETLDIPVIGNGDIMTPEDALTMVKKTKCDGIMIGRASIGKPWIFKQIKLLRETGKLWTPTPDEIIATIREHYELVIAEKGERIALMEMRTHLSAYTKGYRDSAKVRAYINQSLDIESLLKMIEDLIMTVQYK